MAASYVFSNCNFNCLVSGFFVLLLFGVFSVGGVFFFFNLKILWLFLLDYLCVHNFYP